MEKNIKEMLEDRIKSELEGLEYLETGSQEKSIAIENIARLYKLKIEESKNELEIKERLENNKYNELLENRKLKEQVKDRYFRLGIAAAEIILPLGFYAIWMNRGFKFEETGTYTSTTFRGLFNHFRPTKK